jgi:threonine 3-dehydrogenase
MEETLFVTGGAGNLACQLAWNLFHRFARQILFDRAPAPVAAVPASARYVRGDLTDAPAVRALLAEHRPAAVLHLASLLSSQSERERELAWRVNVTATFDLFESCLAAGVPKFVFASSLASYGGSPPSPLPEDFPQWPEGLYGVGKQTCERLGAYYHARHALDFRAVRLPIVVSPFAHAGAASAYASAAFLGAVGAGEYVFRVRPTTRAGIVYATDALAALEGLLAADPARLTRRVYNIHGAAPTAEEIRAQVAARVPAARLSFDPDPQVADLVESWPRDIDDASARRDWDWRPKFDLPAMADDFIRRLRADRR